MPTDSIVFLSIHDVCERTRLARSTIYSKISKGEFPAPVKLSERASAWVESEIQEWAKQKISESRGKDA